MLHTSDLPTTPEELLVWKLEHTNAPIDFKTMMHREHRTANGIAIERVMTTWIGKLYRSCPEVITLSETNSSDSIFIFVHGNRIGAFDAIDILDIILHIDVKFKRIFERIDRDGKV